MKDGKLHLWMDETSGEVSFSAYDPEDPNYEVNHVVLVELRQGKVTKHGSLMNIITNVLSDAGVQHVVDWA